MTPERWTQIEKVLDTLLDREPATWPVLIDEMCEGDADLKNEIETLLRHYPDLQTFMETASPDSLVSLMSEARTGQDDTVDRIRTIGKYKIIREIAHGGMGRVFLAERADGQFDQQVALKLLHSDLDTENMRRRFRAERQILASLNHPNIARLIDGGVTKSGFEEGENRPYIVMEYVEGKPIIQYCTDHNLSISERLKLFMKVAEAIRHAHRNLIVHCDIKPSNILVTEEGEVKLIDFGIARILDENISPVPPATQTVRRWMTPEYAAPEQIRGDRATTSTDVYQLGVLLYELLTGRRPFDREGENLRELEQRILEEESIKPSVSVESKTMSKILTGDLDAIVLKALRKEPEARYSSVEGFIDDLNRYFYHQPVQAKRGTILYRSAKYLRRHKAAGIAVSIIASLMIGYLITITIYADRVSDALDEVQKEVAKTTHLSDFLIDLFVTGDPFTRSGDEPTIREFLDRAVRRIDNELAGNPVIQSQLLLTLGLSYSNLGHYDQAQSLLVRSMELRRDEFGSEHPETAKSMVALGQLVYRRGDYEDARSLFEQALSIQERMLGMDDIEVATTSALLGNLYKRTGELSKAQEFMERARDVTALNVGKDNVSFGRILNDYGLLLIDQGEYAEARDAFQQAAFIYERELGPDHILLADLLGNLSHVLGLLGEHEERVEICKHFLAIAERELGTSHVTFANALLCLGNAYRNVDRNLDAIPLYERAFEAYKVALGQRHPFTGYPLLNLGNIFRDEGDYHRAVEYYKQAKSIWEESQSHTVLAGVLEGIGRVKLTLDEPTAALPYLERALTLRRQIHPEGHWRIAVTQSTLGECLIKLNRYNESHTLLTESFNILRDQQNIENRFTQETIRRLVELYEIRKQYDRADIYRKMLADAAQ